MIRVSPNQQIYYSLNSSRLTIIWQLPASKLGSSRTMDSRPDPWGWRDVTEGCKLRSSEEISIGLWVGVGSSTWIAKGWDDATGIDFWKVKAWFWGANVVKIFSPFVCTFSAPGIAERPSEPTFWKNETNITFSFHQNSAVILLTHLSEKFSIWQIMNESRTWRPFQCFCWPYLFGGSGRLNSCVCNNSQGCTFCCRCLSLHFTSFGFPHCTLHWVFWIILMDNQRRTSKTSKRVRHVATDFQFASARFTVQQDMPTGNFSNKTELRYVKALCSK